MRTVFPMPALQLQTETLGPRQRPIRRLSGGSRSADEGAELEAEHLPGHTAWRLGAWI